MFGVLILNLLTFVLNGLIGKKPSLLQVPHDDVIKWKHFPRYWPFVRGLVNSPHKGQWRGPLMFSLICACMNRWVNNRQAGDLRHHCAHYDVTVMTREKPWPVGFGCVLNMTVLANRYSNITRVIILGRTSTRAVLAPILITWTKYDQVPWHQGPLLLTWFNFNPSMDK